jgi:hypothetical protein
MVEEKKHRIKSRLLRCKFWSDEYISSLEPTQKLLYIYLLTNELTTVAGVYEISIRRMEFDTGLSEKLCGINLDKFQNDNKVFYKNNWIVIRNFIKNQDLKNTSIVKGILNELELIPKEHRQYIESVYAIDRQGAGCIQAVDRETPREVEVKDKISKDKISIPAENPAGQYEKVLKTKVLTPQAHLIEQMGKYYEHKTGEPFKSSNQHFIIVSNLIKQFGVEKVIERISLLAEMCDSQSAWFTKSMADFRPETLSKHWNSIIKPPGVSDIDWRKIFENIDIQKQGGANV